MGPVVVELSWRQARLTVSGGALLTEQHPLLRCTKRALRRALRRRRQLSSGWPRWTRRAAMKGRPPCGRPWRWASGGCALAYTPLLSGMPFHVRIHDTQCTRHATKPLQSVPAGGPGMVYWLGGACRRLLSGEQPAMDMLASWGCTLSRLRYCIMPGRGHRMFLLFRMQFCCLCLRQGTDAAFKERGARLRAEPEAQAHAAARENNALLVSGAAQPGAQQEAWAAPAAPVRSAGCHGPAPAWVPAERERSVSSAAAAPLANAGRTGMPACGTRARETGPAYTLSGGPGRTAHPAPPPLYGRAGAMWPMI